MDIIERLQICLRREGEPDRIPSFVQAVMSVFSKNFYKKFGDQIEKDSKGSFLNIQSYLGFDSAWIWAIPSGRRWFSEESTKIWKKYNDEMPKEQVEKGYYISRNGGRYHKGILSGEEFHFTHEGILKTEEIFHAFYDDSYITDPPEDAVDIINNYTEKGLKKNILPIQMVNLLVEPIIGTLSLSGALKFGRKNPQFLKKALNTIIEINRQKLEIVCQSNAPIIVIPDDCAFKTGPLFSPKFYREFILPHLKEFVALAHKNNKLVIFHSDGHLEPYYEMLIEIGMDAHQSLEPTAGMNIKHLKEKYGENITLIGNIDCSRLLPYGTKEEVIEATKKCLKDGSPGGGYIFSPCTDITNACKVDNVVAMMETYKKYRNYPVNI